MYNIFRNLHYISLHTLVRKIFASLPPFPLTTFPSLLFSPLLQCIYFSQIWIDRSLHLNHSLLYFSSTYLIRSKEYYCDICTFHYFILGAIITLFYIPDLEFQPFVASIDRGRNDATGKTTHRKRHKFNKKICTSIFIFLQQVHLFPSLWYHCKIKSLRDASISLVPST